MTIRGADQFRAVDALKTTVAAFQVRNLENDLVAADGPESTENLLPPMEVALVRATAAARFTGGGGTQGQPPAVRLVVKVSMQRIGHRGVSKEVIF